jgi:hypothetical protein
VISADPEKLSAGDACSVERMMDGLARKRGRDRE